MRRHCLLGKPLWNLLEDEFTLVVVNAAHTKAVPGRKTDVKDCEWIADLLHYTARGLQDTIMLPVGGEVVIRKPFLDFTGKFVYHCHSLNHEDAGMMAVIEVVP